MEFGAELSTRFEAMRTSAMIPIKTNNERLPGKNTRDLMGKPLYAYLFTTLKECKDLFEEILIDSSDPEILSIAEAWGFTPSERPEGLNSNGTTGDDLIARVIDDLDTDILGLLHVTSPFLKRSSIEESIQALTEPDVDSVFGVVPRHNRFWFQDRPVNHNPEKLVRTQELTPVFEESDFYFFKKASFQKYKKRVCGITKTVKIDPVQALDVDTMKDFLEAEAILREVLLTEGP